MLFGLVRSSSASLRGSTIIPTTTTTDPATSHVCISCILYASNDYFSPSLLVVREKMRSIFGMVYVYPLLHSYCWHPWLRGGSTGSWTGCNLKTGRCCMIAFLPCLNFALPILRPILRLCLSLPMLVPQGYSALFVSILSGESKELITMMKVSGVQRWKSLRYDLH